jgi:hypothetical protein
MKKLLSFTLLAVISFSMAGMAQTDSHNMSVTVAAVNVINVDNDVSLTISTATPGFQLTSVSDNTTANLLWTTNGSGKRIMVKTGAALPTGVTLTVGAQNITKVGSGTPAAAGTVTLSTTDTDFVTGAGKSAGSCDLNYTASATVDAAIQANSITVTYTITN